MAGGGARTARPGARGRRRARPLLGGPPDGRGVPVPARVRPGRPGRRPAAAGDRLRQPARRRPSRVGLPVARPHGGRARRRRLRVAPRCSDRWSTTPTASLAVALGDHRRIPRQLGTAAAFGAAAARAGHRRLGGTVPRRGGRRAAHRRRRARDHPAAVAERGGHRAAARAAGARGRLARPARAAAGRSSRRCWPTCACTAGPSSPGRGWTAPRTCHRRARTCSTRHPGRRSGCSGDRLTDRVARGLVAFPRSRGAAAKVDLVLSGPVPWAHPEVARRRERCTWAGSRVQTAAAEAAVASGRHADAADRPGQRPRRGRRVARHAGRSAAASGPTRTCPAGSTRDVTQAVIAQVERFAPGFRDLVVASRCIPAARLARPRRQPRRRRHLGRRGVACTACSRALGSPGTRTSSSPPAEGRAGSWLCSSSTPPGPGVHGLSGWYAARRALRDGFGISSTRRSHPGTDGAGGPSQALLVGRTLLALSGVEC